MRRACRSKQEHAHTCVSHAAVGHPSCSAGPGAQGLYVVAPPLAFCKRTLPVGRTAPEAGVVEEGVSPPQAVTKDPSVAWSTRGRAERVCMHANMRACLPFFLCL